MSAELYHIIRRPLVTEKTNALREVHNQYAFEVAKDANKVQIRSAVEKLFGVTVLDVRTSIVRGKMRRLRRKVGKSPNWKKATVTLADDDSISIFEGV
jgi:large subunit ribosomal protein L23